MCADTAIKNNLAIAMAVLIVGGGCLGWVGNKAVDYTFSDVRENTEFRIGAENEIKHVIKDVEENTKAIKDFAQMKELLIRIDERTKKTDERTSKWEPQAQ